MEAGDIILFGSYECSCEKMKNKFMINTVFVIGEIIKVDSGNKMNYENYKLFRDRLSENYYFSVIEKIFKGNSNSFVKSNSNKGINVNDERTFTLYRGATIDNKVNGMYSFFPCRRVSDSTIDATFNKVVFDIDEYSLATVTQGNKHRLNIARDKEKVIYEEILVNYLKDKYRNLSKEEKIKIYCENIVLAVLNAKNDNDVLLNISLGVWAEEPNFFDVGQSY